MRKFLIAYEHKNKSRDYTAFFESIKGLGTSWWHYLDTVWIVKTTKNASDIFASIEPHIDKETDLIFINEISPDQQGWLPKKAWEWMH